MILQPFDAVTFSRYLVYARHKCSGHLTSHVVEHFNPKLTASLRLISGSAIRPCERQTEIHNSLKIVLLNIPTTAVEFYAGTGIRI